MIPGWFLRRLAKRACSQDFHHRVVEAQLADFQHEWASTSGAGQRVMILARGYGAFWCALGSSVLSGLRREILAVTWRDAFPFPGVLAIVVVSINLAERWVRTGGISGIRFDSIDTRYMWPMVPLALVQRCWPTLRGVRGFAVHAALFYMFALPLSRTDILREQMRGLIPFVVLLAILTIVQRKKTRVLRG
jgi:hypothetical protein